MPIYAYRCEACGHAKDVLQKVSDPLLTTCPACGAESFKKQVTAAGFQLKGSGWYVTDFRNGPATTAAPADKSSADAKPPTEGGGAAPASKEAATSSDAPKAASAAAPAALPSSSTAGGGSPGAPTSSST